MTFAKIGLALLVAIFATLPATVLAQASRQAVRQNPEETKKLNTFLSNFSEVFMESFSSDSLTDRQMIHFGVAHNYRNRTKLFEKLPGGEKAKIKATHVSESAQKYLGRKIVQHQTAGEYKYRDGYYFVNEASGEILQFSQVARVLDLGHNQYLVDVNIYSASSGWTGNVHGSPVSWKKSGDDAPQLSQKMKATIAKNTGADGKHAYTLIEYIKNQ